MTERRLQIAGLEFRVRATPEVFDLLHFFYPWSISRPGVGDGPGRQADVSFTIDTDGDSWLLARDGRPIGTYPQPTYALLALEYEVEKNATEIDDGRVAVHAGAVATDLGAWLIAGSPESGKTSSTFQLLQLGQAFLCEEVALYDPDEGSIHPYLQTPALDHRYVESYRHSFEVEKGALVRLDDSVDRFIPERFTDHSVRLSTVLLPSFRPGTEPVVEQLPPESIFTEMLGYCFAPASGNEVLIDAVIDLLERSRILKVTFGDHLQARELLAGLLNSETTPV